MNLAILASLAALGLFGLMLLFSEVGRRIGVARLASDPDGLAKGASAAEAAVFALLGLLIAFTFSGAASRFEDRRELVSRETEAIGTAFLRIDLLPEESRRPLRDLFRSYLDARILAYSDVSNTAQLARNLAASAELQSRIWAAAVSACNQPAAAASACMLLLPALNQMFDITTARVTAMMNHPPAVMFYLLAVLTLIGALLIGYSTSVNQRRAWLHPLMYALSLCVTFYLILDLEYPRRGLIRVDAADQLLIDLRRSL